MDAWDVLIDAYWQQGRWVRLEDVATHALALYDDRNWQSTDALMYRARARIELGWYMAALSDIDRLERASRLKRDAQTAATLRALLHLRAGFYWDAYTRASACLNERRPIWLVELQAVRFEAAHMLDLPEQAGALDPEDIVFLRSRGCGEWMDRLMSDYGAGQRSKRGRERQPKQASR